MNVRNSFANHFVEKASQWVDFCPEPPPPIRRRKTVAIVRGGTLMFFRSAAIAFVSADRGLGTLSSSDAVVSSRTGGVPVGNVGGGGYQGMRFSAENPSLSRYFKSDAPSPLVFRY